MRLNFLFARVRRAVSGIMGLAMTALPGKAIGEIYTDVEPSRPIPVAAYQHPDKQSNEQTLEVTLESTLPAAGEGVTDFANGWRIDTFGLEGDHNHWDTIGVRIYSTSNPYYEIRRVITNAGMENSLEDMAIPYVEIYGDFRDLGAGQVFETPGTEPGIQDIAELVSAHLIHHSSPTCPDPALSSC